MSIFTEPVIIGSLIGLVALAIIAPALKKWYFDVQTRLQVDVRVWQASTPVAVARLHLKLHGSQVPGASSFSYTARDGPQGIFQLGANLRHSLCCLSVIPYVDVTFLKDHIPTGDEKRVAAELRFPLAAMRGSRRRVKFIENLSTGERHSLEWGGVRLRIDQQHDPALLFRCFG
jgi:hypothetical protein